MTAPARPSGIVLVLHGGASRRASARVSPTQLSVLRMKPIARRIARAARGRLAVFRVLNSHRGWDASHTPIDDARWALHEAQRRLPQPVPVSLVGHSLGGRAALLAAGLPGVRSVVALAPWVYPTDVAADLDGQKILIVHGTADRIASPSRSRQLARVLSVRADVTYVEVLGGKHAMLKRHALFERLAAQFVALTVLDDDHDPAMRRIAAGERSLRL